MVKIHKKFSPIVSNKSNYIVSYMGKMAIQIRLYVWTI